MRSDGVTGRITVLQGCRSQRLQTLSAHMSKSDVHQSSLKPVICSCVQRSISDKKDDMQRRWICRRGEVRRQTEISPRKTWEITLMITMDTLLVTGSWVLRPDDGSMLAYT